ncbi:septum formation protein Maf [Aquibacillus halophilus]|uniref:dTTP/UTP pyrophosphatase n=1 Tax=Aquibacillus halophilus TaxID=930132 RepID=A0A6A8DB83_9BACI|nr:septum formation protein Maf [Aquibacillus halophilus]
MVNELVLASGSPRRQELLKQMGISYSVRITGLDESKITNSDPKKLVEELARLKGENISLQEGQVVLSADTVVSYKDQILTKPTNAKEALTMLSNLNGNTHVVYTGVMIRSKSQASLFSVATEVEFWDMSNVDLKDYVDSGEWKDKAGGYGIQSIGAFLVREIRGDYYNVVGLPLSLVLRQLKEFSIYPSFPKEKVSEEEK